MSSDSSSIGVVLDVGSLDTKAGFAGEAFPRCIVPTTVGRFCRHGLIDGFPDVYFAKEAIRNRGVSNLTWPVKDGMIDNWEEMEKFWHHIFYKELHVAPEQAQILHAVHPLTPRRHKERMAEILFESFMIRDLYLATSSALCLHASGRTSGVVWENGFSCCYSSPVFEGFPLKHATVCSKFNGQALSDRLNMLLQKKGYSFTTPTYKEILDQIKAKLCYVSKDFDAEVASHAATGDSHVRYDLPDGQHVLLGQERYMCPEILFRPTLHSDQPSIVDDICNSISKCDIDYKPLFFNNVVISGGSSMFPGLPERLGVELTKRVIDLPGITAEVDALSSRSIAVWAGGSIMASLSTIHAFWMTRAQYEDVGSDSVNRKFY
ncbi:uncharacterized protein [Epargyreus clarus]|uniref:uncharacterized protein n=1 Tax=Epargyreus clarus TaxID=520877 RepID=UPI003C2B34DC